jgi:hypothetical protein
MLDDSYKMVGRGSAALDKKRDDHELKPVTLAILAVLFSPLFVESIPLARLVLIRARQHPDQARTANALATAALILSYAGILLVVFLAVRYRRH